METIKYEGRRLTPDDGTVSDTLVEGVMSDGKRYLLRERQDLRNHSPTGFAWGYGGSGPAQLALALLADATDDETALRWYQEFKGRFVAGWGEEWCIDRHDILSFVRAEFDAIMFDVAQPMFVEVAFVVPETNVEFCVDINIQNGVIEDLYTDRDVGVTAIEGVEWVEGENPLYRHAKPVALAFQWVKQHCELSQSDAEWFAEMQCRFPNLGD